jgi:hypothetical protein
VQSTTANEVLMITNFFTSDTSNCLLGTGMVWHGCTFFLKHTDGTIRRWSIMQIVQNDATEDWFSSLCLIEAALRLFHEKFPHVRFFVKIRTQYIMQVSHALCFRYDGRTCGQTKGRTITTFCSQLSFHFSRQCQA